MAQLSSSIGIVTDQEGHFVRDDGHTLKWKLVADTNAVYNCSIKDTASRENDIKAGKLPSAPYPRSGPFNDENETNYFKSLQWSPDGTSLLTSSADNKLRFFIVPPTLLDPSPTPDLLTPYTTISLPEPTYTTAIYPQFSLSSPSTTLVLAAPRDHPIQLFNLLDPSPSPKPAATYPLINPTTEVFETPSSMIFHPSGSAFYTGTDCLISLFDVSRPGEGPSTRLPTIPSKRHKMKGGGVGMRGIVSALSLQPSPSASDQEGYGEGMLAAGTWTRWVSLYDAEGLGGTVANWSIAPAADEEAKIGGGGVSQVLWSGCGRYLYVVERKSRGVLVFDVRVTGKMVGWCEGRKAETNQRLGVEVVDGEDGSDIYAGGSDGYVRKWSNVGMSEGGQMPDENLRAYKGNTAVGGIGMHSCKTVLATASGSRKEQMANMEDDSETDNASDREDGVSSYGADDSRKLSTPSKSAKESKLLSDDNIVKVWNLTTMPVLSGSTVE